MYLMIDNYDSFVYNLKAYFEELGKEIAVIRCDKITLEEIEDMQPSGIILSPGPKRPQDATLCIDIALVQRWKKGYFRSMGKSLRFPTMGFVSSPVFRRNSM